MSEKIEKLRFKKTPGLIPFMEIFGPTIQGEGMVIGQKTIFMRTAFCQYSCSWCDSKFTWDGTQEPEYITPVEAAERIVSLATLPDGRLNCKHVTLTGGNPSLIGEEMKEMILILKEQGWQFSVETQGVNYQDWFSLIDQLVISPKPPSSCMKTNFRILDKIVKNLQEEKVNFTLKVVVFDDIDFEYARKVHQMFPDVEFYLSVGNEDATSEGSIANRLLDKLEWLWDKVLEDPEFNDVKPLPQLHTLVYDNKRGV